MLDIKKLSVSYDKVEIIKDISFSVNRGEVFSIIGPNGSGKTTILKSIANIIKSSGKITLDKEELKVLKRGQLARKIGILSQNSNIYFSFSVYDTVMLGRYSYKKGLFQKVSNEDIEKVETAMKYVGITDIKDRYITELSGGQLQRVFLARLIAQNPEVLLLDEPTNHLDIKYQVEIIEYARKWAKENNKIVITVLHDLNLSVKYSDNILLLENGNINYLGNIEEFLKLDNVNEVYNFDVKTFMANSLKKWK